MCTSVSASYCACLSLSASPTRTSSSATLDMFASEASACCSSWRAASTISADDMCTYSNPAASAPPLPPPLPPPLLFDGPEDGGDGDDVSGEACADEGSSRVRVESEDEMRSRARRAANLLLPPPLPLPPPPPPPLPPGL